MHEIQIIKWHLLNIRNWDDFIDKPMYNKTRWEYLSSYLGNPSFILSRKIFQNVCKKKKWI